VRKCSSSASSPRAIWTLDSSPIPKEAHVDSPRVAFETIPWQVMAPGARHKMVERDGKRIRLVDLTDSLIENDWCLKGHVG